MNDNEDTNANAPILTYEGGFDAVVERMQARQAPLSFDQGESLPPLKVPLEVLKSEVVRDLAKIEIPRVKDQSGHFRKSLELTQEFLGMPELCRLHALLIAHLRKSDQPDHTMALFTRIWTQEAEFLFEHLDPRWLVSAITTFGDHGQTETQRRVGQSMTVLFASMKLYESERLYSGFGPENEFKLKRLVHSKLPLNMDRYALVSGGLDINMLGRLWVDAKQDEVIAPLAHHLLNLLNADPGTVFRRFLTLRGRKIRQRAQKALNADEPEPEPVPARAKSIQWGVVSTIKADIAQIKQFTAHHLGLGAAQIDVFLDAPLPEDQLSSLGHSRVSVTTCDAAYWAATGKPIMEKHRQRQTFNATRAYRDAKVDWLAHIDCDEFIFGKMDVEATLRAVSSDTDALMMPPAEEIAQNARNHTLLFRRTYFDAGCEKAVLNTLYPTFGNYLRSGFISHTAGKTIARTGLSDVRFGLHLLKRNSVKINNLARTQDLNILHRHARDFASFNQHLEFRLSKGSYRDRGQSRMGLGDIIDLLRAEHGEDGPRLLFDEVCAMRDDVIEVLDRNGMLIRTKLLSETADG